MSGALDQALAAVGPATTKEAAIVRGLLAGYHARWIGEQEQYTVLGVEELVTADLRNLETGRPSRSFRLGGKIDLRVTDTMGRLMIWDHKTTSDDIEDPASSFWRMLAINSQASQYLLLEWLNGRKIDFAVWDVIRKPGIRPRGLTKSELAPMVHPGIWTYCGVTLTQDQRDEALTTQRESFELYEYRLALECQANPNRYFQRRMVPRTDEALMEHAAALWNDSQDLLELRRNGRTRKNPSACMNYGKPCRFLALCSGYDAQDSGKWRIKDQVHTELSLADGDGRDLLTNSRLETLLTCKEKHRLHYEVGLERIAPEDAEELIIGTLMHTGLEAWNRFFMKEGK